MTFRITGTKQLEARIKAMKPSLEMMQKVGLTIVSEAKRIVPHKTRNLSRSIHVVQVGKGFVEVEAGADYAGYVEFGTKAHLIRPRYKKALFWKGLKHPVPRVRHPGTTARPYMVPAVRVTVEKYFGGRSRDNIIVNRWNKAG